MSAPQASPSHHVRHTSGIASVVITSPRRSESEPIVALATVPAMIPATMQPRPRIVDSGESRPTRRRMSTVARTTSSRLPHVCPIAEPSGSAE
jgi:hypothetical protein